MSHPENTLKQIIERQDKKIEELRLILKEYIQTMAIHNGNISLDNVEIFMNDLEEVRKL